ncbi:hypothetical protein Hena1_02530 [Erwinia phage Hena1]|uniref:Uncharacterized protein n=1 Tax=Erwinia phage Hena1 TaxID=2678601 RepID=A0A6B9JA05_9CAUD|nr:hypothetical protein HWC84_gp111 [Erwinia phage Hena1]QGZ16403.1 hypothetical protein Hena1_02530 [Erwinia phage Hena1]
MNNTVSVNETEIAVAEFLKSINVSFKAVSIGMRKDKDWKGDQFHIVLSRSNNGARIATDYSTGTGHRIVRKMGLTRQDVTEMQKIGLMAVNLGQEDWTNDDRKLANKLSAGGWAKVFAITPGAAGVIYSLISDASCGDETHADFCANLGYDEDSRKGLEIYLACQKIGNDFNSFFTSSERETLRELLEDY